MKKKHYLVYKTTCLLNGKIYIGQHQTYDPDDDYLGSGRDLTQDISTLGRENFKREILFDFDNFEDMDNKEKELVTEEFVAREDTYNLILGGQTDKVLLIAQIGGKTHAQLMKDDPIYREHYLLKDREGMLKKWKEHPEVFANRDNGWVGRKHKESTKKKMSEKAKVRVGEKNSSFGTVWIYNESLAQNRKVKKERVNDFLKQGWKLGRRMDFYK